MKEVSCRALGVVLKAGKRRRVPEALLTHGTPYDLAYLRNTKHRIEWSAFCQILRNAKSIWSLQELSDLNESFMRSFFKYVGVIARLLFTSRDLFAWILKHNVGGGHQLFADVIVPSYEHVGADSTIIRLEIRQPYETSPEFFWMTRGAFVAMPRAVGAGAAQVDMEIQDQVGVFRVRYKNKRGTLASLIRLVSWPFTARTAARELQRTNEELQERFFELVDARAKLNRQATRLRTAHTVNELVQRDLDLDRTLETISSALVVEAGFASAEITTATPARSAQAGSPGSDETLSRTLSARGGQTLGELVVAIKPGADRGEREELLAFIAPSLAVTLENAIYRTGLERLVEERTGELRQARDQLAGTVEQLREAKGARDRFFGNISHEIRTPLSIIMLAVGDIELRAGKHLDDRAKASLGTVNDSARKLVRLVDELLLLAAGQEDKLALRPEPIDLVPLITQLVAAWLPASERAGLELVTRLPEALIVKVDPVAIERVITNLVSNAVKYTPHGGRVELELAAVSDGVRLSVLDTGPGFDEELAGRLFGRYERSRGEDRRKVGTGIGLSLVKQLVEGHGGTIAALPRATGGSEMRITLPAALVSTDLGHKPTNTPLRLVPPAVGDEAVLASGSELPAPALSAGKILLAEDDRQLADMIARMLAEEFTVVVAHDGAAALELVKQHQPELLITDVEMPRMDGIELARRFREQTGDRLAPVIILSAVLDLQTRVAGLEAGAVDYVTKPFDPIELRARVRSQFRMRELAVRLHRAEQLSALGMLTSGLAHELRNPANGIVNAIFPLTSLLPEDMRAPEHPVAQLLEVISDCAEQLNAMAKQLLGFRAGAAAIDKETVSLEALVRRSVSMTARALEGVELRLQLAPDTRLSCGPHLLTQVLTNLIENAGHAAGRGGWVSVTSGVGDGVMTLAVTDSGAGVAPHLRERIFEPFFTTKPPGVGTGLGLPVSREIIQRHGGTLEVREQAGRTAFVIALPMNGAVQLATNVG